MDIRNPTYNAFGGIDCEIEHPVYGWIPFTATVDDVEPLGAKVFAYAVEASPEPYVAPIDPTPEEVLAGWRATARTSKTAFCLAAYGAGILAPDDAIAAAQGIWPATLAGALAGLPEAAVTQAKITWAAAQVIERSNPLVLSVAAFLKLSGEQIDGLFL